MGTTTATSLPGDRITAARVPHQRRIRGRLQDSFRLPGRDDPAPHPARLAGICAWAAALGLLGLPVAARASVALIAGVAPGWFESTVVAVGMAGIALTAAAFAAIHRRWLPWLLLATATVPLAVNVALVLLSPIKG